MCRCPVPQGLESDRSLKEFSSESNLWNSVSFWSGKPEADTPVLTWDCREKYASYHDNLQLDQELSCGLGLRGAIQDGAEQTKSSQPVLVEQGEAWQGGSIHKQDFHLVIPIVS